MILAFAMGFASRLTCLSFPLRKKCSLTAKCGGLMRRQRRGIFGARRMDREGEKADEAGITRLFEIIVVSELGHFGLRRLEAFVGVLEGARPGTENRMFGKSGHGGSPVIEPRRCARRAALEIGGVTPKKA